MTVDDRRNDEFAVCHNVQMTWLITAAGVILTDVGIGLLIGVLFSLLTIVFRTQRYIMSCLLLILLFTLWLVKIFA